MSTQFRPWLYLRVSFGKMKAGSYRIDRSPKNWNVKWMLFAGKLQYSPEKWLIIFKSVWNSFSLLRGIVSTLLNNMFFFFFLVYLILTCSFTLFWEVTQLSPSLSHSARSKNTIFHRIYNNTRKPFVQMVLCIRWL